MDKQTKTPKVTKAQRFTDIKHLLQGEAVENGTTVGQAIEALNHELEILAKKNNTNRKPTPTQIENEKHKETILQYLTIHTEGATCSDMIKSIADFNGFSTSKVSSLTSALVKADKLTKEAGEKGKTIFKLA